MNIIDYLFTAAVNTVWSNPHADSNVVFKTNKLTTQIGAIGTVYLPFGDAELPTTGKRYMLVELGDISAEMIGLQTPLYGWVTLQSVVNTYQTLILGFSQGRKISLKGSYIQILPSGNILFAIDYEYNLRVINLNDSFYLRLYTNAFYVGNNPTNLQQLTTDAYLHTADSLATYINFIATINTLFETTSVAPLIFKNGLFLPDGLLPQATLQIGDLIDYISDPFIKNIDVVSLIGLESFYSEIDSTNKIIVSMDSRAENIYVDDTECYVSGVLTNGTRVGAYFPRIAPATIRALTYKDLAINSLQMDARVLELEQFIDINQPLSDIKVHLFRRNTKQYRPTIFDSSYLPDLLALETPVRKQVLTGINSTFPLWEAANLENCPFNVWQGLLSNQLSLAALTDVFSRYGAVALYERVRQLPNNVKWSLPEIAGSNGGILLGHGNAGIGLTKQTFSAMDHTNETYENGFGYEIFYPNPNLTKALDKVIAFGDMAPTSVITGFGIFCYYVENAQLVYALHNVDYTLETVGNNTLITWRQALINSTRYVRTTQDVVMFTKTITITDIVSGIDVYNGRAKSHEIGMGILSIWYNGRYLIEGLDYILYQAKIYLISKTLYWTDVATLDVVYSGLPDTSLQHIPQNNWGWIKYGKLLNDGKYDLLMYRNRLFYVDGRAIPFSDLHNKEMYTDVTLTTNPIPFVDGNPYAITNTVQISRSDLLDVLVDSSDAEAIRDAELTVYLSNLDPQPVTTGIIVLPRLYRLVSPFMNAVIAAVINNTIPVLTTAYTDDEIVALVSPFNYLLHVDPCLLNIDSNFSQVSPMWDDAGATVRVNQFSFLSRVNSILLKNQVQGLHLYLTAI